MVQTLLLLGWLLSLAFILDIRTQAFEDTKIENSDPFILLSADKTGLKTGEEFSIRIEYGNRGPDAARNVKIILNQPIDGRSPFELVFAQPIPTNWISSEYGNLAEYVFETLKASQATQSGNIEIRLKVRDSLSPQVLKASASLQVPNRERGNRLVETEPLLLTIEGAEPGESFTQDSAAATAIDQEKVEPIDQQSVFAQSNPQQVLKKQSDILTKTLESESLWSTLIFLGLSCLLILAFVAGRRSKSG